jgi:hypothetical protein
MQGKINAPSFIYKIVYGKDPDPWIRGRETNHPTKLYNGINIDQQIPTKALNQLNKIKDIEIRSSCQGENNRHLTFLIFRPKNQNEQYVKNLVSKLNNQENIIAGYDKGNDNHFRIGVTTKLYYSDSNRKEFLEWWVSLPKKIKECI